MTGSEWHSALEEAVSAWQESRGAGSLTIRVTLEDEEWFYLAAAEPGPGEAFVTLSPFPEAPVRDNLIEGATGGKLTPRVVIVEPAFITKLELLYHSPALEHPYGFGALAAKDG